VSPRCIQCAASGHTLSEVLTAVWCMWRHVPVSADKAPQPRRSIFKARFHKLIVRQSYAVHFRWWHSRDCVQMYRKYVTATRTLCTIFSTHEACLYPTCTPKGIMLRAGGETETKQRHVLHTAICTRHCMWRHQNCQHYSGTLISCQDSCSSRTVRWWHKTFLSLS
jgi:hypothetical protein